MTQPHIHKHPATNDRLAVRVDDEWFPNAAEYGPTVVFWNDSGIEINIRADGVDFSQEEGQHQRLTELEEYVDEGGVASYIAPKKLPISNVEVHDVTESEAHECFPTNRGDS